MLHVCMRECIGVNPGVGGVPILQVLEWISRGAFMNYYYVQSADFSEIERFVYIK